MLEAGGSRCLPTRSPLTGGLKVARVLYHVRRNISGSSDWGVGMRSRCTSSAVAVQVQQWAFVCHALRELGRPDDREVL
jgi:hypothetical protein